MASPVPEFDRRRGLWLWVACFGLLLLHAWTFLPFVCDDSLISLRYAQRLLDGEGLTWTDGERVEGYSNLLWVLLNAGLGRLGVDLILGSRLLGVLGAGLAMAALLALCPPRRGEGWLPAAVGPLALALTPPVAIWAIAGLAPTLVIGLLGWALVGTVRALRQPERELRILAWTSLPLALLVLTRADGALFTVSTALALVWVRGPRRGVVLTLVVGALPVLAWLGQLWFRVEYYGEWVPNTAHVKAEFGMERMARGLFDYLLPGAVALAGAVLLALVGLWARVRGLVARPEFAVVTAPLLLWTLYVVMIGGDVFPGWRHLTVMAFCAAALGSMAAGAIARRWPGSRGLWALPALLLLSASTLYDGEARRARDERWEWQLMSVGRMLRDGFAEQRPLLAVEAAGATPYAYGGPCLDMYGLCDAHIAKLPARRSPNGEALPMGHDHGDGDYVLGREPDLVLFGIGLSIEGGGPSAWDMLRDPRFVRGYRCLRLRSPRPDSMRALLWLRMDGGVGVRVEQDLCTVPGLLLGSFDMQRVLQAGSRAEGDLVDFLRREAGRWSAESGAEVVAGAGGALQLALLDPGTFELRLRLPRAGIWRIETDASAELRTMLLGSFEGQPLPSADGAWQVDRDGAELVLVVKNDEPGVLLRELRLRRVGD